MNTEDVRTLFDFNTWANREILGAIKKLTNEEFVRDLRTSYRSVRGTLVHILWGEWLWLERWRGVSHREIFNQEDFPDAGTIEARWQPIEIERRKFIDTLTDDFPKTRLSYVNTKGERWEYALGHMMQHVVNHSSYHRGQLVTLLRQLGHPAPSTDFLIYMDRLDRAQTK